MRDLKKSDRNELVIRDARSGTEIKLYYRTPTTREEVGYMRSSYKRKGKKIVTKIHETRIEYGLKILTGFRDGDFGYDGKPISSDSGSPDYRADWKELLKETASDIISTFAFMVFEGTRTDLGVEFEAEGEEEEEEKEDEEALPLDKSSNGS